MGQVHSLAPDGLWSEIWVPATWTKEQPSKLVSRVENRKRKSVWLCIKVAATFWVSMEVQTPLNSGWRTSNSWPCLSLTDSGQSGPAGHNFLIDIVQEVDWSRQCPCSIKFLQFSSVQSLSCVRLFATPWIAARQASLSITNSRSSPRLTSIQSVMPSSHLILCRPLLLLPPIPPSIRVFSNESTLHMRWPKYWSFSLSIIPSKEIPGLISLEWTGWISLMHAN